MKNQFGVAAARQSAANYSATIHRRFPKRRYGGSRARSPATAGSPLSTIMTNGAAGARNSFRFTARVVRGDGAIPLAPRLEARSGLRSALLLVAFGLLVATSFAHAQTNYAIDWSTIDGGGGTSTGGVYSVSGTIGQPDAGAMSGGNYTVQGGFWGVIAAVQTEGAPFLSVARTTTNTVVVWWPLPGTGWQLQCTTNLAATPGVWTDIAPPYQTNTTSLYHIEPSPTGNKFYRLKK
jgi:hypothetical protein